MEENHLCLEEYGDFVRTKPRRCRLPDGKTATVTYLPCPGPAVELEEPQGCYQLSGDNDGDFSDGLGKFCCDAGDVLPPWTTSGCWRRPWWCASTPRC